MCDHRSTSASQTSHRDCRSSRRRWGTSPEALLIPVLAFGLAIVAARSALAQGLPGQPAAGQPGNNTSNVTFDTIIEFKGKLVGAQGNLLTVMRDSDEMPVTVMLHEDPTRFKFVADAERAYLKPGLMVRATVELGPGMNPTAPIDQLEVFQQVPPKSIPGSAKDNFTPGVHAPRGQPKGPRGVFQPGKYTVVGAVAGVNPAGVFVNTGKGNMPLPLAPEATISLVVNNPSLAQPGDPVSVSGFHQPPDETKVLGHNVVVRVDRVYGQVEERAPRGRRGRGRAARNASAAEAEQPADPAADELSPPAPP